MVEMFPGTFDTADAAVRCEGFSKFQDLRAALEKTDEACLDANLGCIRAHVSGVPERDVRMLHNLGDTINGAFVCAREVGRLAVDAKMEMSSTLMSAADNREAIADFRKSLGNNIDENDRKTLKFLDAYERKLDVYAQVDDLSRSSLDKVNKIFGSDGELSKPLQSVSDYFF
jgi:hypothetical protein